VEKDMDEVEARNILNCGYDYYLAKTELELAKQAYEKAKEKEEAEYAKAMAKVMRKGPLNVPAKNLRTVTSIEVAPVITVVPKAENKIVLNVETPEKNFNRGELNNLVIAYLKEHPNSSKQEVKNALGCDSQRLSGVLGYLKLINKIDSHVDPKGVKGSHLYHIKS